MIIIFVVFGLLGVMAITVTTYYDGLILDRMKERYPNSWLARRRALAAIAAVVLSVVSVFMIYKIYFAWPRTYAVPSSWSNSTMPSTSQTPKDDADTKQDATPEPQD